MSATALSAEISKLENKMYEHAHNLEFEEAARLRDQIKDLEKKDENAKA